MAKRHLHRFRVPAPPLFRNRRAKSSLSAVITDAEASTSAISIPSETVLPVEGEADTLVIPRKRKLKLDFWSGLWLFVFLLSGSVGIGGLWLLTSSPPVPNCEKISVLQSGSQQLYCAQMGAQSGDLNQLIAAVKVVKAWSPEHPLYNESQRMMAQWSPRLLNAARQKIDRGEYKEAVAIINEIPKSSPAYSEAQAALKRWENEWKQGEAIVAKYAEAVKARNWGQAWRQIESLLDMRYDYWRVSKPQQLMQQINFERRGWDALVRARRLANTKSPANLERAIAMAGQVDSSTYLKPQAEAERNKWRRTLAEVSGKKPSAGQ